MFFVAIFYVFVLELSPTLLLNIIAVLLGVFTEIIPLCVCIFTLPTYFSSIHPMR